MPIGAEVNAILILLKVCDGAGWRAAPDIRVHHKILRKLSAINLKHTLETCWCDHEQEVGVEGEKGLEGGEGTQTAQGLGQQWDRF